MAGGVKTDRFEAGSLAKGFNVHLPDFQADVQWTNGTVNCTSGLYEGIGTRYGFAPIPWHSIGYADQSDSGQSPGLYAAETSFHYASGSGTWQRNGITAIHSMRMRGVPGNTRVYPFSSSYTFYVFVVTYTTTVQSGPTFVDACILGGFSGTFTTETRDPVFDTGLNWPGPYVYDASSNIQAAMSYVQGSSQASLLNLAKVGGSVCSASFSVTGNEIACHWLAGAAQATGDATHAPSLGLQSLVLGAGPTYTSGTGGPPSFMYGDFSTVNRDVTVYALDSVANVLNDYRMTLAPTTTIFLPYATDSGNNTNIDLSTTTATKITGGVNYAGVKNALYNDGQLTFNSSYQGVMIATGLAGMCVIFQDWYYGKVGDSPQYVDLANNPLQPPSIINSSSPYVQDGATQATSFNWWPSFTRGTALSGNYGVALGGANTGLLRSNTVYEFAYSVFDKHLNYETNVGVPVKFQVGNAADFVSLNLFNTTFSASATTPAALLANAVGQPILPWPGPISGFTGTSTNSNFKLNYLEYRFYYRQEGAVEWLPALFVDAAKYWFYPHWTPMAACTGGIGGLVGGRPGGFADYSPLPRDNWNCVVIYKNRSFWISDKQIAFSLENNMLAYPQTNTIACPVGSFKGAIVQAYYGQAQQDARIVVFSTVGTYVGKFTGIQAQVPVQVSPTSVGTFGLDGSDFVLNAWTSITAFSYKAAVVAEGILYFWGPQGIFMDDGVNPIQRISVPLEPDLFTYYGPGTTDSINCVYNDVTKEIIWFYTPPSPNDNHSQGLVWNTIKKTWLPLNFSGSISRAQIVNIDGTRDNNIKGTRLVAMNTRAYFFDQLNLAGDIFPGQELMVKSWTTPVSGVRRLVLAAGYSGGTISAGDYITFNQLYNYSGLFLGGNHPGDFVATVAGTSGGAGTIDINVPTGVTLPSTFDATGDIACCAPIWHSTPTGTGINGFNWALKSKYWIPGGMSYWAYWQFLHMVFKLNSVPTNYTPSLSLAYTSPISGSTTQTDTLTLTNNSQNNCQIWHPMNLGSSNIEGQGIALTLSGIQYAGSWMLQFLEAYAQFLDGWRLKQFEG